MKMSCVIVDDEPAAIEVLNTYIQRTPDLILKKTFRDPLKALVFLILCFGSMEAFAEAKTWSGADGASFNVGTNWTPGAV